MSLQPAFPVSPSQSRDSEKQSKMKEICGLTLLNAFALYDHDTHFWKTSQACLLPAISDEYTETWPKQGIMLDGVCWELTIVEPHTGERDGGFWLTPATMEIEGGPDRIEKRTEYNPKSKCQSDRTLTTYVKKGLWPSPSSQLAGEGPLLDELETKEGEPAQRNERAYNPKTGKHVQITLNRAVKMWPSPRNRMTGAVTPNRSTDKFNNLESVMARRTWPIPRANKPEGYSSENFRPTLAQIATGQDKPLGGQLNPDWVEWLMGWPIGWTDLKPLAMGRFQLWLQQHGEY